MTSYIFTFIFIITAILSGCSTTNIGNYKTPKGWSKTKNTKLHAITAPEKDMKIFFHKENIGKDFKFSERSVELWKKIRPDFSYKEAQNITPPSKNWDKVSQIIYQTPVEDSKTILTLLRIKDGEGYFNLIEGSSSTLNKRGPQMMQILGSWKPKSIKEEDYSKVKAKNFKDVEGEFEKFLEYAMAELEIPGMTIGITQDGNTVYQKGFGKTKIKNGSNVNKNTLFMIGSTTKPLTTLLMSKLVYDGKLNWNDPIDKHLSGWSLKDKKISKTFLLKHTACACTGMPRRDLDFIFEIDGFNGEKRMKQMSQMSPTSSSGETFQYSNYLVAAGGFSAARAYNKSLSLNGAYNKAMSELVFKPLKMNHTIVKNSKPYKSNSAYPHSIDLSLKPKLIPLKIEEFADSVAPAGSVWSNSTDMLKYINFELSKGENIPNYIDEQNLLSRRAKGVKVTKNMSYGLGLMVSKFNGIEVIEHGGNTMGFTSEMLFLPKKNIGITILVNLGDANQFTGALRGKFFELMFGMDTNASEAILYYKAETKKGIIKLNTMLKKEIANPSSLTGKFKSKELGTMFVTKNGKKLSANFGEFISELKEITNPGKTRVFILTSPPWSGSFSLIKEKSGYMIDGAQKKYLFKKL